MILFPNAKINVGLFVTRRRPDGFHDLETVFYPVDLCDVLEIVPLDGRPNVCEFESSGLALDCLPGENLVEKAYALLAKDYELPGVHVHLHKVIPNGAGLGGGSADAAFMLMGLNELFALGLEMEMMERYAAMLGSDCAFFVRNRPVFAYGKGELMENIDFSLNTYKIALVKPQKSVSTAAAYRGITPREAAINLRQLECLPVQEWEGRVKNDFEESVIPLVPEIEKIKQKLWEMGAVYVSMTGSGSAVFGLFERKIENLAEAFPEYFTWMEE